MTAYLAYCELSNTYMYLQISIIYFKGEPPGTLIGEDFITPISLWFQRNHHPMPRINPTEYSLTISIPNTKDSENSTIPLRTYTLNELQALFPKVEVISTIECGGNRRTGLSDHKRAAGNAWGVCAISNAKWGGVRLADVIAHATGANSIITNTSSTTDVEGLTYQKLYESKVNYLKKSNEVPSHFPQHVHFISYDQLIASIPIDKALNYSKYAPY